MSKSEKVKMEYCLDVLWLFYYEMEDCNYYLVDEKVREWRIGSVREREMVRDKIIKNCKRIDILLNKCVE